MQRIKALKPPLKPFLKAPSSPPLSPPLMKNSKYTINVCFTQSAACNPGLNQVTDAITQSMQSLSNLFST